MRPYRFSVARLPVPAVGEDIVGGTMSTGRVLVTHIDGPLDEPTGGRVARDAIAHHAGSASSFAYRAT
ncbi:hypothetical protein ACIRU3_21345 [Streptomyces sp. NPDC101151]|uniref:hypothetical protein n=1 Tax=Streptomyces sp. NPDC101151 TaxID=3366115 RepID=UPI0037F9ED35